MNVTRLIILCMCSLLVSSVVMGQGHDHAHHKPHAFKGQGADAKGVMGAGRAVRFDDVPEGVLKKQLAALPQIVREESLRSFEQMTFHKSDFSSMRVNKSGKVYYECAFQIPAKKDDSVLVEKAKDDEPRKERAAVPITSPPVFNSRPGSANVLYLDFNGHVIENTDWNVDEGIAKWECRAFSIDSNTNQFSDAEQTIIEDVWARVAEDFANFDINVTTVEPASWNRTTAHALITPTTDALGQNCPHFGAGGVAYVGVFGDANFSYDFAGVCYSPAWVTIQSGGSYSYTAEAASHEIGHNMGLNHDGTSTLEYYGGHGGTGSAPSWGPIMGTGYGRNVSQWSKGEYFGANNTQDDLSVIAGRVGFLPDDYGDTDGTASSMSQTGVSVYAAGFIETAGDPDVFAIPSGSGTINLSLQMPRRPASTWGGNLDAALLLYDGGGTLLASNNPAASVTAQVSVAVSSGTYYAHVVPVGAGAPLVSGPSGYAVYGSVGPYTLSGTVGVVGDTVILIQPNGGEVIYRSHTNEITWSAGFTNAVDIALYKGGTLQSTIASGAPNTGSYTWVVPTNTIAATNYSVRLTKSGTPANFDESDTHFSILPLPDTLLSENFDASGSLPAGWSQSQITGTATWDVQSGGQTGGSNPSSAYSTPNNMTLYDTSATDDKTRLFTPTFDCSAYSTAVLKFQHHMGLWGPDQDFLKIFFRTNAAASWVEIVDYSTDVSTWTEREIVLPGVGNSCQVAFEGNAKWGYGVCIDDVVVLGNPIVNSSPRIILSASSVFVPEGFTAVFSARLSETPANTVTVNVSRVSGDADLSVSSGSPLIFTTANATNWQNVTLAAAQDADFLNGTADFECSDPSSAFDTATIQATENDDEPVPFGARVISQSPDEGVAQSPSISQVMVTFDQAINPASFSTGDDIASFTGPLGVDLSGTISGHSWANGNTELTIDFTTITSNAAYRMVLGPGLLNFSGFSMDQDNDGNIGEAVEDQYVINFWVGTSSNLTIWSDLLGSDDTPDPNWTLPPGWAAGVPTEIPPDGPNADTDAGTKIVAHNLGGHYAAGQASYSESPDIDGSSLLDVQLDFQGWKGLGRNDRLYIDVGYGGTWDRVYEIIGPSSGQNDGGWTAYSLDISTNYTVGQTFRIRWGVVDTTIGGSGTETGWQLDAIKVSGAGAGSVPPLPVVLEHSPVGTVSENVSSLLICFSHTMDTSSFDLGADIASFSGPSGSITPTGYTWLASTVLRVEFAEQSTSGSYTLSLNPSILDNWGQSLDNNQNGTPGQTPADRYSANFTISSNPDADADGMDDAWEVTHSLNDPNADEDNDGATNFEEFMAGTDPNDNTKYLRIIAITMNGSGEPVITWSSDQDGTAPTRQYKVLRNSALLGGSWSDVANGIPAAGATTDHTDVTAPSTNGFYRIEPY